MRKYTTSFLNNLTTTPAEKILFCRSSFPRLSRNIAINRDSVPRLKNTVSLVETSSWRWRQVPNYQFPTMWNVDLILHSLLFAEFIVMSHIKRQRLTKAPLSRSWLVTCLKFNSHGLVDCQAVRVFMFLHSLFWLHHFLNKKKTT